MIMRSSWFRKPVYKKVNLIFLLVIAAGVSLIFFTPAGWYVLATSIVIWIIFSFLASYNICSGIFISAICSVPVKENFISITFDDGPCKTTETLLRLLRKYDAKATFFIPGCNISGREDIVCKMYSDGHETGNHSFSHKSWFPLMSPKKIKDEINKTQEAIQKITGKAPAFFRPPFGVTNPLLARALNSSDLKIIGWSIRSMDTTYRSQDRIINNILDRIHPGDIILLHDTSKHIINVLEKVLVYCRKENYKPVTISELIKHQV